MGSARTVLLAVAAVVSVSLEYASGFYIPGVAPVEYKLGDNVRVMVSVQPSPARPLLLAQESLRPSSTFLLFLCLLFSLLSPPPSHLPLLLLAPSLHDIYRRSR